MGIPRRPDVVGTACHATDSMALNDKIDFVGLIRQAADVPVIFPSLYGQDETVACVVDNDDFLPGIEHGRSRLSQRPVSLPPLPTSLTDEIGARIIPSLRQTARAALQRGDHQHHGRLQPPPRHEQQRR